jgi:hypothetical protein
LGIFLKYFLNTDNSESLSNFEEGATSFVVIEKTGSAAQL